VKPDQPARQDLAEFGEAFVRGHHLWLQLVHDPSSLWRRNMIALHLRENGNLPMSEAVRRRKQQSEKSDALWVIR
jgi:hypothetical protein